MPDHYIFTEDPRANRNVDVLREYAQKYDIKYFYDITDRSDFKANPDYRGVCHIALAEEAHTMPGEVMFGTDSHTCNAGAFGMFATGIGNTDAGFVLGTGKLLVKVPPTLLFKLEGEMPPYITAKDIILHIIGEIGVRFVRGMLNMFPDDQCLMHRSFNRLRASACLHCVSQFRQFLFFIVSLCLYSNVDIQNLSYLF